MGDISFAKAYHSILCDEFAQPLRMFLPTWFAKVGVAPPPLRARKVSSANTNCSQHRVQRKKDQFDIKQNVRQRQGQGLADYLV